MHNRDWQYHQIVRQYHQICLPLEHTVGYVAKKVFAEAVKRFLVFPCTNCLLEPPYLHILLLASFGERVAVDLSPQQVQNIVDLP